jgi:hypothetical protein
MAGPEVSKRRAQLPQLISCLPAQACSLAAARLLTLLLWDVVK